MNKIAYLLVVLFFCTSECAAETADQYLYIGTANVSFTNNDANFKYSLGRMRLETKAGIIDIGDAVLPLKVCDKKTAWVCAFGGGFAFAIDKHNAQTHWTYEGYDFENMGQETIEILGQSHVVSLISAKRSDEKAPSIVCISYYSQKDGVVGFTLAWASPATVETYFLSDAKGFGADN